MPSHNDLKIFESLYREHFTYLSLVSFNITKDKDASKDITQDFFIYLWEKENKLSFNVSFKAYATRAVKNLSLQYLEKNKTLSFDNKKISLSKQDEEIVFENNEDNKILKIKTIVEKIPVARREIFISHVVEGLSYAEIAEMNNISINTVKTQLKRAYAFIRNPEKSKTLITIFFLLKRYFI